MDRSASSSDDPTGTTITSTSSNEQLVDTVSDLKGAKNLSPLLTEPKVPLGNVVVLIRDAELTARPKGNNAATFKMCVGINVERRSMQTTPCNTLSRHWDERFEFPVTETCFDMELSIWCSSFDILSNQDTFLKAQYVMHEIALTDLEQKPNTYVDYKADIGGKGKPFATITFAVKFKPAPNPFVPMERMLLDDKTVLNTMLDLTESSDKPNSVVAEALNYFFTYTGSMDSLLKTCIQKEVNAAESAETLLRGTSLSMEIISQFVQLHGSGYLLSIIGPLVRPLLLKTTLDVELDPVRMTKAKDEKELKRTQKTLSEVCEKFLKKIISSHGDLPAPIRQLCHWIDEAVEKRFSGHSHTALGGILFLRFICPAIVAPEHAGLFKSSSEIPSNVRRVLILVTKILQNLVNQVEFGEKETHMVCMNKFLQSNQKKCSEYYLKLLKDKFVSPSPELYLRRVPDWVYKEIHDWLMARKDEIRVRLKTAKEQSSFDESLTKIVFKSPVRRASLRLVNSGQADVIDRAALSSDLVMVRQEATTKAVTTTTTANHNEKSSPPPSAAATHDKTLLNSAPIE